MRDINQTFQFLKQKYTAKDIFIILSNASISFFKKD